MHTHSRKNHAGAAQEAATRPNRSLRAWPPELVAYREELRRAVAAIDERRRIASRRWSAA